MAKPKNRQTVYCVVRSENDYPHKWNPCVVATCLSIDRAEELQGAMIQEMTDKGMSGWFEFEVQASTYYDE